jgi:hypothetical protein
MSDRIIDWPATVMLIAFDCPQTAALIAPTTAITTAKRAVLTAPQGLDMIAMEWTPPQPT